MHTYVHIAIRRVKLHFNHVYQQLQQATRHKPHLLYLLRLMYETLHQTESLWNMLAIIPMIMATAALLHPQYLHRARSHRRR